MRALVVGGLAIGLLCAPFGTAQAADLGLGTAPEPIVAEEFEKRWHVALAVYGWAAGLDADVGVAGRGPVNVSLSFIDIVEDLEFAAMAVAEVRYDRFAIFSDLFYTRLSDSETFLAGFVDADLTSSVFAGTLMGEYRVIEKGRTSLDAMAGARVWSVNADLNLRTERGRSINVDSTHTWVDPMIGIKARVQGSAPYYATAWGMVGGFGVSSDFAWDALAAVGYDITDRISVLAGYRAVGVDYTDDGFEFDAVLHGPVVSGVFKF